MLRSFKVSWKQTDVKLELLEGVRSNDDGEAKHRGGLITKCRVLRHHLQVQDVLSGTSQRTCHHQHAAHVTGLLQQEQPIITVLVQIKAVIHLKSMRSEVA